MRNWSARNRRVGLAVMPPAIPTEARSRPTTPLTRPKRRPPRPKHPKFTHFHRSGLRFGRFPTQHRSIGGVGRPRRDRRAWLRHPWVVAGPGRASRRRTEPENSDQAPLVWRAPEGSAAVPVGGGGAWPGFEATRRAKLAARTARGRAAAHRHTQRPGPPTPATPVGPQARPSVLYPHIAVRAGEHTKAAPRRSGTRPTENVLSEISASRTAKPCGPS